ncbi:MAG: penicillin acylase family protein [Actinomycetota bacterium]
MRLPRPFLVLLVLVSALSVLAPPASSGETAPPVEPYRSGDQSVTALNILPPGQGGYLNSAELLESQGTGEVPDHFTDQRELYSSLIQGADGLTEANLTDYFKDASFGVKPDDIAREYSPRSGVTILRDKSFNVPHVYGTTRADTMFGAGYVSAEDRLFMMDVLRSTGRGRLSELLGPSESNIAMDCAQYRVADYTEAELQAMITGPVPVGADPALVAQARQDVIDYTAGINAYIDEASADPSLLPGEYAALQLVPSAWTPTDTAAVASLIGGSLGVGGGGELGNAEFLNALAAQGFNATDRRQIMVDLRLVDDPEAVSSTDDSFPWNMDLGPVNSASVAMPDADSLVDENSVVSDSCDGAGGGLPLPLAADGPFGPIPLRFPSGASNALLVGSSLSKNGLPFAVFGPQVAYWSPEILMELDLHGPGIAARGVGFPGISLYVLLGRGDGYAYSATSASGDQVDIRAVELCDPLGTPATIDSTHYVRFDGQCVPIEVREDSWLSKPSAGGTGLPQLITISTERVELAGIPGMGGLRGGNWGIIQARGEVAGKPVAFVRQRVTYGGEVDSATTYVEMMNPDVINGADDFQRAFGRFTFTFNWFYVDGRDIAFQLGGFHPLRAPGTDPDLPVWDENAWKWPGLLSFEGTPKDQSPAKGYITSWNNKQAPGFRAADDNWGFASVDRVEPLDDRILAAKSDDGKVDLVEVVQAMADAATVDLRGDKLIPLLFGVIGDPGTPRLQAAKTLLEDWNGAGAHRRDLDGNGQYEHQGAIALMDAWWPRVVEAVFGGVLGQAFDDIPATIDDAVHDSDFNGSSFNDGFYGQVDKDLRSLLGQPVEGPFSRGYCGNGVIAACRTALLGSLDDAVAEVEADQGANPADWDTDETLDEIRFTSVGVSGINPIPWQNRPTFQQVVQFGDLGKGGKGGSCPGLGRGLTQLVGTPGNDLIIGTTGNDLLCGFGGRDTLRGLGGRDRLFGAGGRDTLKGGNGRDLLNGGAGNDRLNGGRGRDSCRARRSEHLRGCEGGK